MKRFAVAIKTENASFEGNNKWPELARLLREVADKVGNGTEEGIVIDVNGNPVGKFSCESN